MTVVAREQIFELQRSLSELGRSVDERQAIEMGRRLGATVTVSGAYQRLGERIRITCEAIDVATGRQRATVKVDGRLDDLFELQDRLVSELTRSLRSKSRSRIWPRWKASAPNRSRPTRRIRARCSTCASRGASRWSAPSRCSSARSSSILTTSKRSSSSPVRSSSKSLFLSSPDLLTKSLALTERALAIRPDDADAHVQRGDTLLAMGRPDEAIAALQHGVRLKPDRATAYGSLARAYWLGKGQVDEAIKEFEEMLRLNPEAGYTHLQLAMLYTLRGDFAAAERVARDAIRLQDQVMSGTTGLIIIGAHSRLGYVLYRQGLYDEAILEYRRELELLAVGDHILRDRTSIELNQKLGAVYRRKGDLANAEAHERVAIERFDARLSAGADEPFTRYYLATLFALRGDAEKARAHLELPLKEVAAFTRWRLPRDPRLRAGQESSVVRGTAWGCCRAERTGAIGQGKIGAKGGSHGDWSRGNSHHRRGRVCCGTSASSRRKARRLPRSRPRSQRRSSSSPAASASVCRRGPRSFQTDAGRAP